MEKIILEALNEGHVNLKRKKSKKYYGEISPELKNFLLLVNQIESIEKKLNASCIEKDLILEMLDKSYHLVKTLNLCGDEPASYMFFYLAGQLGKSVKFSIFRDEEEAIDDFFKKINENLDEIYLTKIIKIKKIK